MAAHDEADTYPVAGRSSGQLRHCGLASRRETLFLERRGHQVEGRGRAIDDSLLCLTKLLAQPLAQPSDTPLQLAHRVAQLQSGVAVQLHRHHAMQPFVDQHRIGDGGVRLVRALLLRPVPMHDALPFRHGLFRDR